MLFGGQILGVPAGELFGAMVGGLAVLGGLAAADCGERALRPVH